MRWNGSWIGSFNMQEKTACLGYTSRSAAHIDRNNLNPLLFTLWNIEKNMTLKASKGLNGSTFWKKTNNLNKRDSGGYFASAFSVAIA